MCVCQIALKERFLALLSRKAYCPAFKRASLALRYFDFLPHRNPFVSLRRCLRLLWALVPLFTLDILLGYCFFDHLDFRCGNLYQSAKLSTFLSCLFGQKVVLPHSAAHDFSVSGYSKALGDRFSCFCFYLWHSNVC